MNIRQKLISMLVGMGMSDSQSNEVMELSVPHIKSLVDDYDLNLEDSSDSYPDIIYNILMNQIKPIALKWIEENKPQAWFKPMFQ